MNNQMIEDYKKVYNKLIEYIDIIQNEYFDDINPVIIEKLNKEKDSLIEFNNEKTLSFYVRNNVLLLPKEAYKVLELLSKMPEFGKNKDNYRRTEDYLDTNTTYYEYIKHVIDNGLTPYEFFMESLLHEAMHMCGSDGSKALEEGINELKTREIAEKHSIPIAGYAYSKEVEIAKKLQSILGKETTTKLIFLVGSEKLKYLRANVGEEKTKLYIKVSEEMNKEFTKFFTESGKTSDPYEKARLYEQIDYSKVHAMLDSFDVTKTK